MHAILADRREIESYLNTWEECYISEKKKTGFIATLRLPAKEQRFWGLNDLDALIRYVKRYQKTSDIFLSLNGFDYGKRTSGALRQIRNIGLDIDCHKKGLSADECAYRLKEMIEKATIPNPNLFIRSGKGVQLIYSIAGGASPDMSYLTQYITAQFIGATARLGADAKAADVTRVLRFPLSLNHKYGSPLSVSFEMWRSLEYSLSDLYDYVTPIEETRKKQRRESRKSELVVFRQPKGVITLYTLNTKKMNDLDTLVTLRNGEMTDYRNEFLYTYGFTVGLLLKNQDATIAFVKQMNDRFTEPKRPREVNTTARSAYKQSMEYFKAFSENGHRKHGLPSRGLVKPEKAETIIKKFDITEEEQRVGDMRFLVGKVIKREKNTECQREKRGSVTRAEYLGREQEKTEDKLWQLKTAMEQHPDKKNRELAEFLGVSVPYIKKLKSRLKNELE